MSFPEFANLPYTPHEYQKIAFLKHQAEYEGQGRSQLITMATGLGKSATAALIARWVVEHKGGKVLVLANRDNLVKQLSAEFQLWGMPNTIEKADQRALDMVGIASTTANCVIGSVQTMQGKRLAMWPPGYFSLIIQDEAHGSPANSFKTIYRHFPKAKLLGITATPNRDDDKVLSEIFEVLTFDYPLPLAIANDELAKLKLVQCNVGIDLRDIKVKGRGADRDLDVQAVSDAIGPKVVDIAKAVVIGKLLGPGQTLIFAPCRMSGQALADAFTQLGVPATHVDCKVPDRKEKIEAFQQGTMFEHGPYAALANFNILTTGFNHKSVGNIVMLRPTTNASLVEQILGRGTRKCDGKTECRIIDFAWIVNADLLARPVDLFLPPGVDRLMRDAARLAADEAGEIDIDEAIRLAAEAEKKRQDREAAAKRAAEEQVRVHVRDKAPVKAKSRSFDLFSVREMTGRQPPQDRDGVIRMPATPEAVAALRDLGYEAPEGLSQAVAEMEIRHWSERKACGMASLKQVRQLVRQKYDPVAAADLTAKEATAILGPLFAKWKRAASG